MTGFNCQNLPEEPAIIEKIDVEKVWSGHPVGFSLLTHQNLQFVAYYNEDRQMTIASRKINDNKWTFQRLDSKLRWDSHNSVILGIDSKNCLHISGNMHNQPLVYFRSDNTLDVTSIKPIHQMTGELENKVTYPRFMMDHQKRLLFMYRHGSSGDGQRLLNIYDPETKTWNRLLDTPLLNGREHSMNAYPSGPIKGPDGYFHLLWMWRDTPDARSNHDISYAKSHDLVSWETAEGKSINLPITPDNKDVIVDNVPAQKGLINIGFHVSFDPAGRAVISYHKYDANGNSQIYLAHWEKNNWLISPVSSWSTRWDFGGHGAIPVDIFAEPLTILSDGRLTQSWRNKTEGKGTWIIDPKTLTAVHTVELIPKVPGPLAEPESDFEGMMVHWADDHSIAERSGYHLRWETLEYNRDRSRKGPLPEATMLRVYKIQN